MYPKTVFRKANRGANRGARRADGETVLDIGCGAGMDLLLAARRTGPAGHAIGVDMTDAMIERARKSAEAGMPQVEIRKGV